MYKRHCLLAAAAAWVVGLAALLCDHFQPVAPVIIGMHGLFGIAACGAICLALIPAARVSTRLISRWVYSLMYILAIVRVCLYLYESHPDGLQLALRPVRPVDDFQFYVCCCVIPLWVVRAAVLSAPFRRVNPNSNVEIA